MGNQPSGWVAPPYIFAGPCAETGTVGGGATLLAAGVFTHDPALVMGGDVFAVYKFPNRMASLTGFIWGACSVRGFNPSLNRMNIQVGVVTADFPMADGSPTPASVMWSNNTFINPSSTAFVADTFCPHGYGVGVPPAGPYYGLVVKPIGAGVGPIIANVAPTALLRWTCTVVGVIG